ncbi:hypothetical protein [Bradyrhizobium sp. LTSPM299]|uniref:hypothetical protein n=1 Tax=Bradyrhizobium sp. LTSPM299 TaxID=1619233 RepID=UPI0018CFCF9C|nr:hypothetical protein [Bradyrhizobium sp. LTSPM299]
MPGKVEIPPNAIENRQQPHFVILFSPILHRNYLIVFVGRFGTGALIQSKMSARAKARRQVPIFKIVSDEQQFDGAIAGAEGLSI